MKKQIVFLLLFIGYSNIVCASKYSFNVLFNACCWGDSAKVQEYIDKGFNVNVQDQHERVLLHCAASNGHIEIVKMLVGAGADLEVKDRSDTIPLHYAFYYKNIEIVQVLLDAGANPFLLNENQETIFDQLDSMDQQDRLGCKEIIIFFIKNMDYEKYRKQFNISHEAYCKAWNIIFGEDNREMVIRYAAEVTFKHVTHPLQRLMRAREYLLK